MAKLAENIPKNIATLRCILYSIAIYVILYSYCGFITFQHLKHLLNMRIKSALTTILYSVTQLQYDTLRDVCIYINFCHGDGNYTSYSSVTCTLISLSNRLNYAFQRTS